MNIAQNLVRMAALFPEATAVNENNRDISYLQFNEESTRIASALIQLGIQPGEHVALCTPNSYAWLAMYYGVLKAGAVAVTISAALKKDELTAILDDCRPRLILTTDDRMQDLADARDRGYLDWVVSPSGEYTFEGLIEKGTPGFHWLNRSRDDAAAILYTGGTTGIPKGVILTHQNLQTSVHNVAYNERSSRTDRALCFLPLNHVFAQVHIAGSTIYSGGTLIMQPAFEMDRALDAIKRLGVTKFYAVPTIYVRLLALKDVTERFASVRYCFSAAASMAAELVRDWKGRTGLDIHEAYGMTESASMVTFNHFHRHVVGSVGTPANLVEVEIRDLEGNPVGSGVEGEICIQGPNIMREYLAKPSETAAAFWDGRWFRSGDIGLIDESGYLYIVDRLKDLIITGGENVYPREIEEWLYMRPEIQECAVIGVPDHEYGERVVAVLTTQEGCTVDPVELKVFLKSKLAPYKVPKEYITVDAIPKSSAGKMLKREVKKSLLDQINLQKA